MNAVRQALRDRRVPLEMFFRDDDAGWDMGSLDRLLDLFTLRECPIDLAVIPAALDASSAARLSAWRAAHPAIRLHQHGYAHENHEGPAGRKCEFGPNRPLAMQSADIAIGRHRLRELLAAFDPIFTPPWNRCAPEILGRLPDLGFRMVSADRSAPTAAPGVTSLPVTLDWDRARRERRLETSLARQVAESVGPVGVMLHHATLDREARDVLDNFLRLAVASEMIRIRSMVHWLD